MQEGLKFQAFLWFC